MTLLEKLNELKRLADAATPGPWVRFSVRDEDDQHDADFIAASRTALPQLVEALIYAIDILGEEKRFRGIDRIAELLEVEG